MSNQPFHFIRNSIASNFTLDSLFVRVHALKGSEIDGQIDPSHQKTGNLLILGFPGFEPALQESVDGVPQ